MRTLFILTLLALGMPAKAQEQKSNVIDSLIAAAAADTTAHVRITPLRGQAVQEKRGFGPWLKRNFLGGVDPQKPFNYTIILGPYYSAATSAMLAGGVLGSYSWDRSDPTLQRSMVSATVSGSVKGMVAVNFTGHNYFRADRFRWHYQLKWQRQPVDIWGIGYERGLHAKEENFVRNVVSFTSEGLVRVTGRLYLGAALRFNYTDASKLAEHRRIDFQSKTLYATGVGPTIQYDSRDNSSNATRGWYVRLDNLLYPKVVNKHAFASTDFTLAGYRPLWKGAVGAFEVHSLFNHGHDVPWTMLAQVGESSGRMRGYYEGRYRDRNIIEAQIELRQHVWKKLGVAVFGGGANVFPYMDNLKMKYTLPNYGVGLRYKFKGMVLRLDYAMTKNKPGFVFNINEAF